MTSYRLQTAQEVRSLARQLTQQTTLKEGYQLWCRKTGNSLPFKRELWILHGNTIVSYLDQGCAGYPVIADSQRNWIYSLGLQGNFPKWDKRTKSWRTFNPYSCTFLLPGTFRTTG